jgi:hypothetical protein
MVDIPGYEGLYAVTSCGKVWSYKKQKFKAQRLRKDGYMDINLYKDRKVKSFLVHRLVAQAYIPNPLGLSDINHLDENRTHNWVNNLQWCSHKDNNNYGTHNERIAKAHSKPVYCVELDKTFPSLKSAGEELNIHSQNISACCKGKQKTTGGYHWRYAE